MRKKEIEFVISNEIDFEDIGFSCKNCRNEIKEYRSTSARFRHLCEKCLKRML